MDRVYMQLARQRSQVFGSGVNMWARIILIDFIFSCNHGQDMLERFLCVYESQMERC